MMKLFTRTLMRHTLSFVAAAVTVAGCASAGSTTQAGSPRRETNLVTAEELAAVPEGDLYSALQRLRPSFFQTHGITSPGVATQPEVIQVYIDGSRAGDVTSLRQLRPNEVREVRHLSASEATQLYGTGNTMGAIVVRRK